MTLLLTISRGGSALHRLSESGPQREDLGSPNDPQAEWVARVRRTLDQWQPPSPRVVLGLGSDLVYRGTIDTAELPRRNRRQAMHYKLEEHFPIDLESLTVDFLPSAGDQCLGVAATTARLCSWVDDLESAGILVEAIVPTALLAFQGLVLEQAPRADYLLCCTTEATEILRLREGRPLRWITTGDSLEEAARALNADLLVHPGAAEPPRVLWVGSGDHDTDDLGRHTGAQISVLEYDTPALAQAMLVQMDRGRQAPWADLRRDALAPPRAAEQLKRTISMVVALAVICLLSAAGILLWRADRYRQRADVLLDRQEAIYQGLYPDTPVPLDVKGRLQSEARKVDALSGLAQALPQQPQALDTLRRVIEALPESIRLRITDIQVTPSRLLLEGQLRRHADAETLYRSLAGAGFEMEAPRTEALRKGGVAFTLIGSLPQGNATTAAGPTGRTP